MLVKEYSQKVDKLMLENNGKVPGFLVNSDIGISVTNINGLPSLTFCKVDSHGNPLEIIQCLSIDTPKIARRMQVWLEDCINIHQLRELQNTDMELLVAGDKKPTQSNVEDMPNQK